MRHRAIAIDAPGKVRGLKRTRATVIAGHARVYEDNSSKADKAYIRLYATDALRRQKIYGIPPYTERGVKLRITAYSIPPKSWSKKKIQSALNGEIRPLVKPDADNIAKLVLDALNAVLYRDDKDVAELTITKHYDAEYEGLEIVAQWEENTPEEQEVVNGN